MWLRARQQPVFPETRAIIMVALALLLFLTCSAVYTLWAVDNHSRQACAELHVLATSDGATTAYDRTIKNEYKKLFELRCG